MTKKNIIWSEIQRRAMAFVKRWAGETDEQRESQTFWNEFFGIFDVDRREVARFEDRAKRHSTGKKGRLDLFWPKVIAVEQKSKGKDLDDAEWQLSDYEFDRHMTPELFVVSDFNQFRIWNLETGDRYTFTITELPKYTTLFAHLAGYKHESFKHEEKVSREAAELLGQLFEYLDDNGYSGHPLRVFIVRLLFCVFADDTNVWRRGLFDDFITYRTSEDGSDVGPQLNLLFQVLNQNEESRQKNLDEDLAAFPYINGGLFSENIPIPFFDTKARSLLLQASSFDWTPVSPIIFGSLFQSVKDKEARRMSIDTFLQGKT